MIRSCGARKGRVSTVGFCWSDRNMGESLDLAFPSVRMAELFYEFLKRYKDWKLAKLQASIGTILVLCLGLVALLIPWNLPRMGVLMSLGVLILLYFSVRYYLEINKQVSHLYINVNILHHHLSGKLEVGFCDHYEPCQCVENFRSYVLRNYRISFENDSYDNI